MGRLKTQIDVAENEIIRLEFILQKEQELPLGKTKFLENISPPYIFIFFVGGKATSYAMLDFESDIEN